MPTIVELGTIQPNSIQLIKCLIQPVFDNSLDRLVRMQDEWEPNPVCFFCD